MVAVVAVLALVVVAPAPAAGAHPPVPLCGGCTGGFEDAAADHGANATVQRSELALDFHANGTATGEATVRVDERAANRFQENASLLDAVARDAFVTPERSERSHWASDAVIQGVENVRASIDARTVTVRFALPDVARDGYGGVVYTDLFLRNSTVGGIDVEVDRATITGPEGSVLVRSPHGWGEDEIVLEPGSNAQYTSYGGYVAWSQSGGVGGDLGGELAAFASIWTAEASTELPAAAATAWVASVLAGALAGLLVLSGPTVGRVLGSLAADARWLAVGYALATVGCLAATVLGLLWLGEDWLALAFLGVAPGTTVAAGATAVLAVADGPPGRSAVTSRVPTVAFYALPVLGVLAVAAAVAAPGLASLAVASASVPLVGVLGLASARGVAPAAGVAATFALAPLAFAFPLLSPSMIGTPSPIAWVVVVAALGAPLFALGRRAGTTPREPPRGVAADTDEDVDAGLEDDRDADDSATAN